MLMPSAMVPRSVSRAPSTGWPAWSVSRTTYSVCLEATGRPGRLVSSTRSPFTSLVSAPASSGPAANEASVVVTIATAHH